MSSHGNTKQGHANSRNLREEQKEYTRRRLMEAAVEVFSRDGYAASRVEDITASLGSSRATFYLHFGGKAEVVRELILPIHNESVRIYDELGQLASPSRGDLRSWMERKISWWESNMRVLDIAQEVVATDPKFTSAYIQTMEASAEAMAGLLVRQAGVDRKLAQTKSLMLILQLERFSFFWLTRESEMHFDRSGIIDVLTDLWWSTINSRT